MLNNLKWFLKKFWIVILLAVLINVPVIVIGTVRTNTYLNLKGDTTPFTSVVDVDTNYQEAGSFSTIYIISFNHSTLLENWITKNDPTIYQGELSTSTTTGTSHISSSESYKAGKIQYKSSIYESIILAYTEAKKDGANVSIDYKFDGAYVTWYNQTSEFRIGDHITAINSKEFGYADINDETTFRKAWKKRYVGDVYTVIRDGKEYSFSLSNESNCSSYTMYDINLETIFPHITIKDNWIGGPSGGLLQTLSIYNRITEADLTHGLKIAGTGAISYDGTVGGIGGISQKIPTAIDDDIKVFFCPEVNYDDAMETYNFQKNNKGMKVVKVKTFYDALDYLRSYSE